MIKHLYDSFAERYYRGGSIYLYSDTHFNDLDCYKIRCEALSKRHEKKNDLNEVESEMLTAYHMYMSFAINEEDFVKLCDEAQVKSINKVVHKCDTIIFLGDIGDTKYISKLKAGYKVLIMGNHDKGASNYKRVDKHIHKFEYEMLDEDKKYSWNMIDPTPIGCVYERIVSNNLFDEVYEGNLYISDKIKLSHAAAPETGYINLHGHDHSHNDGYCFAAEHINYTPVCLKKIFESGALGKTTSFRRSTVDKAIERKAKRNKTNKEQNYERCQFTIF